MFYSFVCSQAKRMQTKSVPVALPGGCFPRKNQIISIRVDKTHHVLEFSLLEVSPLPITPKGTSWQGYNSRSPRQLNIARAPKPESSIPSLLEGSPAPMEHVQIFLGYAHSYKQTHTHTNT